VVLFIGPPVLTLTAAREAIDAIVPAERQGLDLETISEGALAEAVGALRQVGMFSQERCVWLRGLAAAEEEVDALLEFLAPGLPQGTALIANCESIDRRSRLFKWFKKEATVVDLELRRGPGGRLAAEDVRRLATSRIMDAGLLRPNGAVLEAIAKRAGSQVGELVQEIDKLCLGVGPGQGLTVSKVASLMRDQAGAWVFDLTDALSKRRPAEAERLVEGLLDQGEHPLGLLGLLSTHFATLIEARRAMDRLAKASGRGKHRPLESNDHRLLPERLRTRWSPGRAFHLCRSADAFSEKELVDIHRRLVALDTKLKRSPSQPLFLFVGFIHAVCPASVTRPGPAS
jgi:DNA polymerase-3 subunit delta